MRAIRRGPTLRLPSAWAIIPVVTGLLLVLPLAALAVDQGLHPAAPRPLRGAAGHGSMLLGSEARRLAHWVVMTGDHAGAPFIIVDKKKARVLVFETDARLRAHSAVLLGAALGDDSVPGIGTRPMSQILPSERTTPAGRFVAERGRNHQGEDVVWVDYEAAISMHRVRTGNPVERRAERLASTTLDDNRISYGCINVPVAFYETFIQPIFAQRKAMVYVLPDNTAVEAVFGSALAEPAKFSANRRLSTASPGRRTVAGNAGAPGLR